MKNKTVVTLFRSDLFAVNVGDEQQRNSLIEEILETKAMSPEGISKSNPLCWRQNNPCKNIDWLMTEIINLLDSAVEFYNNEDSLFASLPKRNSIQVDYWANVNESFSRNSMHCHKPADFSACYYLDAENTGAIRFINPSNTMAECSIGSPFVRDYKIEPRNGDLLLWPSWLPHEVETNLSGRRRINLAFDLKVCG
jgi:uncharacterized protein (TIGR02466 family)